MAHRKFIALTQLLGCYLHQDWVDEFESDIAALKAIVESEPKSQINAAVSEIDSLLSAELGEEELRSILVDEIACYFDPMSRGTTWEEWLQQARNIFLQN